MRGPLLAAVLLAVILAPGSLAQSSCRISVAGSGTAPVGTRLSASAITAATVACTGQTAAFTGPSALQQFATDFTGVNFTVDTSAPGLLTFAGNELTVSQSSFTNLNIGGLSVLAVLNATLTVTGSTFSGNTIAGGASVLQANSTATTIRLSRFTGNTVADFGGGVSVGAGSLVVEDSIFTNNTAGVSGGAISFSAETGSSASLNNVTITGNTATCLGGGAYFNSVDNVTVTSSVFSDNTVTEYITSPDAGGACQTVWRYGYTAGDGLYADSFTVAQFNGTTFDGNGGNGDGGAMFLYNGLVARFIDTNITNNIQDNGATGGVIIARATTATFDNCNFLNNTGQVNGGIQAQSVNTVNITNSVFRANQGLQGSGGTGFGGGLFLAGSCTTRCFVDSNEFTDNTVPDGDGGGIYANAPTRLTFSNNLIDSNFAANTGGGFSVTGSEDSSSGGAELTSNRLIIDTNTFRSNRAVGQAGAGGGLAFSNLPSLQLMNTIFEGNNASNSGGGAWVTGLTSSNISVSNCTFTGNAVPPTASVGGGLFVIYTSLLNVTGSTATNNSGNEGGGFFFVQTNGANVSDCTLTNNNATLGGGIAILSSPNTTLALSSSTIANNTAGIGGGVYSDTGTLITMANVREFGNTANSTATADLGCDSCKVQSAPGAAITTVANANAAASSTAGAGGNSVVQSSGGGGGGGGGLSGGAIAGIVIGVLAGLLILAAIAFLLLRRRKRRRNDVEKGKHMPAPAVGHRSKVASAFSDLGTGSFWSQKTRSTANGSTADVHSDRLDELSSHEFGTDKTAKTADTYNSRGSSAPLINMHSGTSNGTRASDMTSGSALPEVPWNEWHIDARDIQVARRDDGREWKLGGGAFGEVYKAMLKGVNPVAVKVLRDQSYTSRDEFSREVALLKALHNSNIVQFQGACVEEDKMLLITEYMDGGDLFKAIARKQVSWKLRGRSIAIDVLRGLHFLHSKRIVHMDLKSPNILLTRHGVAKLADVGLAKVIRDRNYITQVSVIGTFAWAAPEVLTNEKCTEKADIFSFGIVLWEIVTGEQPVRGGRREVRVPEECTQEVADIIDVCLKTDPNLRPTASTVLEQLSQMDSGQETDVLSL